MNAMNEIVGVADLPSNASETAGLCTPFACDTASLHVPCERVNGTETKPESAFAQTQFQPFENEKHAAWQAFAGTSCGPALCRAFERLGEHMAGEDDSVNESMINFSDSSRPVVDEMVPSPVATRRSPHNDGEVVVATRVLDNGEVVAAAHAGKGGVVVTPVHARKGAVGDSDEPINQQLINQSPLATPAVIARCEAANELPNAVTHESPTSPRGNLVRMSRMEPADGQMINFSDSSRPVVDEIVPSPIATHRSPRNNEIEVAPARVLDNGEVVAAAHAGKGGVGDIDEPINQQLITQSPLATPAVIARGEAANELPNAVTHDSPTSPRGNLVRMSRMEPADGQMINFTDSSRPVVDEKVPSPVATRRSPRNGGEEVAPARVLDNGEVVAAAHAGKGAVGDIDEPITQLTNTRIIESLRASAVAIVSAIQVSPTLATTGMGEIRIELNNEILDGSIVRFEVTKGDLSITVHPGTQAAAHVLEKNVETFQAHLAERVTQWRVNVGVTAWSPRANFKRTEREA